MFPRLTLVFQQRRILVQGDDFYQSQTAETYCDPLKKKNQCYEFMCSHHQHCCSHVGIFLLSLFFSITPKGSVSVQFLRLDNLSGNHPHSQTQH